jgi:hypothetical protein
MNFPTKGRNNPDDRVRPRGSDKPVHFSCVSSSRGNPAFANSLAAIGGITARLHSCRVHRPFLAPRRGRHRARPPQPPRPSPRYGSSARAGHRHRPPRRLGCSIIIAALANGATEGRKESAHTRTAAVFSFLLLMTELLLCADEEESAENVRGPALR